MYFLSFAVHRWALLCRSFCNTCIIFSLFSDAFVHLYIHYAISLVYYIYITYDICILAIWCQHVTNLGYLWNMCSRLQLCIYNQTYWWQWLDYYMSPRPNIMHVLRWHCRSVLPIPWLWLPPSARRMAQIIIEIIIITIIITERGHETRLKSNMCFVLNGWSDFVELIIFTDLGLSLWWQLGFCGMFSGTAFPDPRRRGAFKVPAVDVAAGHVPKLPWVCCSGACARCDVLWQRQRCSNARRQKTCCSFLGGTFGFFGCTFIEMTDWTASCWILPASHLINTSPCQASTGFQSCLHVIFELVFVSFWCPRHFIFHSFTFPIPWGMCHCLFMT